ncbi:MAG: substrate-binding domain-containing protein [Bacteroidales bacterium]|nr:substrate-binding domain-containing protein [Bacteroidales bacterium]
MKISSLWDCLFVMAALSSGITLNSCEDFTSQDNPSIHIGVSQCAGDQWRDKMNDEMRREAIFHHDITFDFCNAQENPQKQDHDVDSLLNAGIDLLVIAPTDSVNGARLIKKAKEKQIPVIVAERRAVGNLQDAFIGGDNYAVGYQAAQVLISLLPDGGEVLEIRGRDGSSPVEGRHQGFFDGLKQCPSIQVVASVCGYWERDSAQVRMEEAMRLYPNLKAVFGHNDYMAMGAHLMYNKIMQARQAQGMAVPEDRPLFIGADAVYGPNQGIAWVEQGLLDASILYPTGGDIIIKTAVAIMNGEPYEHYQILPTYVIDARKAGLANNLSMATVSEVKRVHLLQDRELSLLRRINVERMLLVVSVAFVIFFGVTMMRMRKNYRERQQSTFHLMQAYRQLLDAAKNETSDPEFPSIRPPKEESASPQESSPAQPKKVQPVPEIDPFIKKVYQLVDENYQHADFGVEQLSVLLDMSRSHLYRKVKQKIGITPFDIIRDKRFSEAEKLLKQGLESSEVASRVGYSSVAYFEKCFEEYKSMSD